MVACRKHRVCRGIIRDDRVPLPSELHISWRYIQGGSGGLREAGFGCYRIGETFAVGAGFGALLNSIAFGFPGNCFHQARHARALFV